MISLSLNPPRTTGATALPVTVWRHDKPPPSATGPPDPPESGHRTGPRPALATARRPPQGRLQARLALNVTKLVCSRRDYEGVFSVRPELPGAAAARPRHLFRQMPDSRLSCAPRGPRFLPPRRRKGGQDWPLLRVLAGDAGRRAVAGRLRRNLGGGPRPLTTPGQDYLEAR